MSERVWSEKDLARRAKRRLAVLQHAEEAPAASRRPAATTASAAPCSTGGNAVPGGRAGRGEGPVQRADALPERDLPPNGRDRT